MVSSLSKKIWPKLALSFSSIIAGFINSCRNFFVVEIYMNAWYIFADATPLN